MTLIELVNELHKNDLNRQQLRMLAFVALTIAEGPTYKYEEPGTAILVEPYDILTRMGISSFLIIKNCDELKRLTDG